jgi:hypothetical protein
MSYPIQYQVDFVERRNRLTTFFRLLIAIPWLIVAAFYMIGAFLAAIVAWFTIVFTGQYPPALYDFIASSIRLATRVNGFTWLLTDTMPPFDGGAHDEYPVHVVVPPALPEYDRVKALIRIIMLIPVYIIVSILGIVQEVVGFVAWLAIIVTGSQIPALHQVLVMTAAYQARALAYFLLVTEEFPPVGIEAQPAVVG